MSVCFPHVSRASPAPRTALTPYALLLCALLLRTFPAFCAPADAGVPAPAAFEMAWPDVEMHAVNWRTFDTAGRPLDKALYPDPPLILQNGAETIPPFGRKAPLGSLWKLFVYLWLVETGHDAPPYRCTGSSGTSGALGSARDAEKLREEESYCCNSGEAIERDAALVRSCGLFFSPRRLGVDAARWRDFWRHQGSAGAPWLEELAAMRPETLATPVEILNALSAAPPRAREKAAAILLARVVNARDEAILTRHLGGQLRIKTFSWFRPDDPSVRYGGGAGWLADGTPVWFAGTGTGQTVMAKFGRTLAGNLPAIQPALAPGCVRTRLFARHPLARVEQAGGKPALPGVLRGDFVARFANSVALPFRSNGEIRLVLDDGKPRLEARLGVDDYVARVLDREADATAAEAARALAVIARSFLLNTADKAGNCLVIEDSSHTQRVSPNPPSAAARAVAGFTSGLVLAGAPVGFHRDRAGEGRMAWTAALADAKAGKTWDLILREAFPRAGLRALHDPTGQDCAPFPEAERWLSAQTKAWRRVARERLPGFEPPSSPQICRLAYGNPFSEQDRNRIHLRALKTANDRVTLAHEWLHLGLARHPAGQDEENIEHWARILTGEAHE